MSLKQLKKYCEATGKKSIGFKDIEPFLDRQRVTDIGKAFPALFDFLKEKDETKKNEKLETLSKMLTAAGMFMHPASLDICLSLESKRLEVSDTPFELYFSPFTKKETIGGLFVPNKSPYVLISLSSAINLISRFLSNVEPGLANKIQKMSGFGAYRLFSSEKTKNMLGSEWFDSVEFHTGARLFTSEMDKIFPDPSIENYMATINLMMKNFAIHEAAHALHYNNMILASHGPVKEELRAHLTEFAYGNPGIMMFFLPKKLGKLPNGEAVKQMIDEIYSRFGLYKFLNIENNEFSAIAKQMLDEDFVKCFGMHHDQLIQIKEIEKARDHEFLGKEHIPMLDALRYIPEARNEDVDKTEVKEGKKKAA